MGVSPGERRRPLGPLSCFPRGGPSGQVRSTCARSAPASSVHPLPAAKSTMRSSDSGPEVETSSHQRPHGVTQMVPSGDATIVSCSTNRLTTG